MRARLNFSIYALLVVLLSPLGCFPFLPARPSPPSELAWFFRLPPRDQDLQFKRLSLETQYEICAFAATNPYYSSLSRAMDIAERREEVLPFVVDKLKSETRGNALLALFDIVYYLKLNGSVDIGDKEELLDLMERRLPDMKEDVYGHLADTTLRRIRVMERDRGRKERGQP